MAISITFDLPPSGNRYWRHSKYGKPYLSNEAKNYRELVAWTARQQQVKPLVGPIKVEVDVYRKARRGDIDNFSKQLLDATQSYLYADDDQIVELHMRRFDDKKNPRVEVKITRKRNRRKAL